MQSTMPDIERSSELTKADVSGSGKHHGVVYERAVPVRGTGTKVLSSKHNLEVKRSNDGMRFVQFLFK
jgi:hypothetical protein